MDKLEEVRKQLFLFLWWLFDISIWEMMPIVMLMLKDADDAADDDADDADDADDDTDADDEPEQPSQRKAISPPSIESQIIRGR